MDKSVVAKSRYGILNQIEIKTNSIWAANRKIVSVQCDGETFFSIIVQKTNPRLPSKRISDYNKMVWHSESKRNSNLIWKSTSQKYTTQSSYNLEFDQHLKIYIYAHTFDGIRTMYER